MDDQTEQATSGKPIEIKESGASLADIEKKMEATSKKLEKIGEDGKPIAPPEEVSEGEETASTETKTASDAATKSEQTAAQSAEQAQEATAKKDEETPQEEAPTGPQIKKKATLPSHADAQKTSAEQATTEGKQSLTSHTGRKIVPLNEIGDQGEADEEDSKESEKKSNLNEPTIADQATKPAPGEESSDASDSSTEESQESLGDDEAAHKLEAISGELKARENEKEKKKEKKDQENKVFDTKKYNLPIKASRHHRAPSVNPVVVIILVSLLIASLAIVAVDMGLIDLGVELPFDFF